MTLISHPNYTDNHLHLQNQKARNIYILLISIHVLRIVGLVLDTRKHDDALVQGFSFSEKYCFIQTSNEIRKEPQITYSFPNQIA